MKNIAILIHQYGDEIVGGAESYARSLAEHLKSRCRVTVLTTASKDYATWEDVYPLGKQKIKDVDVIRFSAEKVRNKDFAKLCNELGPRLDSGGETTYQEDFQWIDWEGPYCPSLIEYVKMHHDIYDAFIVITYIYYIAVKTIPEIFDKTIFIPTAHDETWIRLSIMKDIFRMPRFFGFLTEEERELVYCRFHNEYIPSDILGIGIEVNGEVSAERFKKKFNVDSPYLIYVGRIDASKNCDELISYFLQYKNTHTTELKLVLVGKGNMPVPKSPDIIVTGFVSEEEKYDAIAGAFAMVTPSKYESLCIALLESLALKVPVIANGQCAVLKGQCIRSNAGLYYENEEEFGAIIDYLHSHPMEYKEMGMNGLKYIEERYKWDKVVEKVLDAVSYVGEQNKKISSFNIEPDVEQTKVYVNSSKYQIEPIWEDAITIATSTDKNYADFAGMVLHSAIINASDKRRYDFLILTNDIEDTQVSDILAMIKDKPNINIRFIYMSEVIEQMDLNISKNYNEVTYFRLLLPQMTKKYDKIIYLDADLLVLTDLERLWEVDLGDYLLAGTWDSLATAWQTYDSGPQAYFESLGLTELGEYMQAGVFVFNNKMINREFPDNYLIEQACNKRYLLNDQDILNILCKGKIKQIEHAWNVRNYTKEVWAYCKKNLPRYLSRSEENVITNPKIIHYCESSFPCWKTDRMFNDVYWRYAWGTPFYDRLLQKRIKKIKECSEMPEGGAADCKWDKNLLSRMNGNEKCQFEEGSAVLLSKGGEVYGPNLALEKGKHTIIVECECAKGKEQTVYIVAGARHILLGEFKIFSGVNQYCFNVSKNQIDMEILIKNENEEIKITKVILE